MSHLLPNFSRALVRYPATNFADGITNSTHLGRPDYERALRQYDAYLDALRDCGLDVTVVPADDRFPDGHFVEDPLVIFHDLAFCCRSGEPRAKTKANRLCPGSAICKSSRHHPMRAWTAAMSCSVPIVCLSALSERTNRAGVAALRHALQTVNSDIRVDAVPFDGVLHLKSGLTELAPNVLFHDPALKTAFDLSWATVITLPSDEGRAADVMPVNDTLFVAADCPRALHAARDYCDNVVPLDMSEFRKMDGGLTCLSLRY